MDTGAARSSGGLSMPPLSSTSNGGSLKNNRRTENIYGDGDDDDDDDDANNEGDDDDDDGILYNPFQEDPNAVSIPTYNKRSLRALTRVSSLESFNKLKMEKKATAAGTLLMESSDSVPRTTAAGTPETSGYTLAANGTDTKLLGQHVHAASIPPVGATPAASLGTVLPMVQGDLDKDKITADGDDSSGSNSVNDMDPPSLRRGTSGGKLGSKDTRTLSQRHPEGREWTKREKQHHLATVAFTDAVSSMHNLEDTFWMQQLLNMNQIVSRMKLAKKSMDEVDTYVKHEGKTLQMLIERMQVRLNVGSDEKECVSMKNVHAALELRRDRYLQVMMDQNRSIVEQCMNSAADCAKRMTKKAKEVESAAKRLTAKIWTGRRRMRDAYTQYKSFLTKATEALSAGGAHQAGSIDESKDPYLQCKRFDADAVSMAELAIVVHAEIKEFIFSLEEEEMFRIQMTKTILTDLMKVQVIIMEQSMRASHATVKVLEKMDVENEVMNLLLQFELDGGKNPEQARLQATLDMQHLMMKKEAEEKRDGGRSIPGSSSNTNAKLPKGAGSRERKSKKNHSGEKRRMEDSGGNSVVRIGENNVEAITTVPSTDSTEMMRETDAPSVSSASPSASTASSSASTASSSSLSLSLSSSSSAALPASSITSSTSMSTTRTTFPHASLFLSSAMASAAPHSPHMAMTVKELYAHEVLMEGKLHKEMRFFTSSWKPMYVAISYYGIMHVFESASDCIPKYSIALSSCRVQRNRQAHEFGFELAQVNTSWYSLGRFNAYRFHCEDEQELKAWIKVIKSQSRNKKRKAGGGRGGKKSSSSSSLKDVAVVDVPVHSEGKDSQDQEEPVPEKKKARKPSFCGSKGDQTEPEDTDDMNADDDDDDDDFDDDDDDDENEDGDDAEAGFALERKFSHGGGATAADTVDEVVLRVDACSSTNIAVVGRTDVDASVSYDTTDLPRSAASDSGSNSNIVPEGGRTVTVDAGRVVCEPVAKGISTGTVAPTQGGGGAVMSATAPHAISFSVPAPLPPDGPPGLGDRNSDTAVKATYRMQRPPSYTDFQQQQGRKGERGKKKKKGEKKDAPTVLDGHRYTDEDTDEGKYKFYHDSNGSGCESSEWEREARKKVDLIGIESTRKAHNATPSLGEFLAPFLFSATGNDSDP